MSRLCLTPEECAVVPPTFDGETRVRDFFSRYTATHFQLGPPEHAIGGTAQV